MLSNKKQESLHEKKIWIDEVALTAVADLSDGDARIALNGLQLAIQTKRTQRHIENSNRQGHNTKKSDISEESTGPVCERSGELAAISTELSVVSLEDVKKCLQKTHLLYDRAGDEHYHCISALHKSMRGSDANASLYWLTRMLCGGEDPLYVARRIICFASEDVGKIYLL